MPFLVSSKTKPQYDVIIVGSGAGGGTSAYVLALAGVKVLMLEAGRKYDPVEETPMFQTNAQAPLRAAATSDKPFGFHDATVGGGWTVPGEPYMTRRQGQPADQFSEASEWQIWGSPQEWFWWRPRMLGGRTNHWGRISLRMGPYDFKPRSRDGLGLDWPIDYKDLEPYYDKVESLIGVWGTNEGLENTPDSRNGTLLPPPRPRVPELFLQKHARALGVPIISSHMALLSRKLDAARVAKSLHPNNPKAEKWTADSIDSRLACFWATDCGRGCSIKANYQSTTVHLPPALASGNLDIVTDAMVREVTVNDEGRATGVYYVDKKTKKDVHVKARVVLLAASGCESARILLNSKSPRFSNGLANASGKVGRYLMDTVGAGLGGQIPALENMPVFNDEGANMHVYSPWWLYKEQLAGKLGFPRGYHIEVGGGRPMPGAGQFDFLPDLTDGAYGKRFKEEARRYYGSVIGMSGRGEMIPNDDSYCEVDPDKKDAWGIPVLRFRFKWSDYEIKQSQHMRQTFKSVIESMGGKVFGWNGPDEKAIAPGGSIIHEVGTTAMGDDPRSSVLNAHCQAWEIKNLFVTDGGPFVSNADKNPTLSIMALAWRTCDYVLEEMRKGNI
ncbi:MAG TPA: GMC family oxidoreductase [Verrucomicrobiae bacterium]|jgi:choline dehydrogenase-like flavoprotein|nr:GMC family oxidoreductase [Verrucomicrobiae bacterium]